MKPGKEKNHRKKIERKALLHSNFLEDLHYWISSDPRTAQRLIRIIEEILREPFQGIGKPEPLRHLGSDIWSRRLTQSDRIVYLVGNEHITFLQARYHY